jgi:hypothetical protein
MRNALVKGVFMAIGRWLSMICVATLVASPALATTMINEAQDFVSAQDLVSTQTGPPPAQEATAEAGGLSTVETAVMLLGSLVFSAVLLGRKPD